MINVFFKDLTDFTQGDIDLYRDQLSLISDELYELWKNGKRVNLNLLTHLFYQDLQSFCGSGKTKFALAPDGNFYLCPAFYFDNETREKYRIGNLKDGLNNIYENICDSHKNSGCRNCIATHCIQCSYLNKKKTGEFCVPPEIQCVKSNIERIQAAKLYKKIRLAIDLDERFRYWINDSVCLDPIIENRPTSMSRFKNEVNHE